MHIAQIEVFQTDLPYAGGTYYLSDNRSYDSFDATIVRLTTDCGLTGWGESTPFGATYIAAHGRGVRAGLAEIAPMVLGQDPRLVDRLYDRMDRALVGHAHVKAAIDAAAWDIFGKALGLPCHALLGGSTGAVMPLISSIHAGTPEDMRARVADHRARGYRGHSIKIGATDAEGGPRLDAERIKASLADAAPGEYFIVDANGGLSPETALRLLSLVPAELDFVLEAPCATWAETMSLRQRCTRAIVLDELVSSDADVAQLIAGNVADGFGLKITKSGGLTPGRRQRDMARAAGLSVSVQDTVGSAIAFAALAHLGQTVPERTLRCILDTRDMVSLKTAELDAIKTPQGIRLGDRPGLGLEVDISVLGDPVATYA